MSVRISAYMQHWFDACDVLGGPGKETVVSLDAVLDSAFAETQTLVHVVTGSLKGSGRVSSSVSEAEWSGEITYGGPSPGFPHDPVRYAKEEFGRGLEHDALRNVDLVHADFEDAMYATLHSRMRV